MRLLKTLLLFLLLSCVARAEIRTVIASYYYGNNEEDFALQMALLNALVHKGWRIIEVKNQDRTLYFVLQSPEPVKAP